MKVFTQEKLDGLEEKIKASASISYASFIEPCTTTSQTKYIKSLASVNDADLYYVQSILVSSSWNKNDDIFDKAEVWVARNTPEDKPTNLEHDESNIVGHITANWPVTEDGMIIDENTPVENLPEKYHILTASVIYNGYSIPELRERSQKLIAEIESGEKYVSMECFFKGFDYGLLNKSTGEFKILPRNDSTAYLTKYLRSYGGLGEHDDYKIGRVLRKITFSGKGFVDKPANPDSIIFTKDNLLNKNDNENLEKKDDFVISGVSKNQSNLNKVENSIMNQDTSIVEKPELVEASVETAPVAEVVEPAQVASDRTIELENSIKAKDESISALSAEIEALKASIEAMAKKMKEDEDSKNEENKNLKAALEMANDVIAGYKNKEAEMAKTEKKNKRVAFLVEAGVDSELAVSTVEKFESLDDETFNAMTSLFAGKMPPWLDKTKKEEDTTEETKKKKKASEETVDVEVLETAEPEATVELGVGGEVESEVSTTRAALVDFVYSRLGTVTK